EFSELRPAEPTARATKPLAELGDAWDRDLTERRLVGPLQDVRHQLLLAGIRLLPSYALAGVGRHATHDRHQRAVAHVLAVVDRLARPQRLEHLVVFNLVHVARLVSVAPFVGANDLMQEYVRPAFGAVHVFIDVARGVVLLAALADAAGAILPLVVVDEVVVDVAKLRIGALLSTADRYYGVRIHVTLDPRHHVERVDVLLGDVVT